jgi:hypothetical protein
VVEVVEEVLEMAEGTGEIETKALVALVGIPVAGVAVMDVHLSVAVAALAALVALEARII